MQKQMARLYVEMLGLLVIVFAQCLIEMFDFGVFVDSLIFAGTIVLAFSAVRLQAINETLKEIN